MRLRKRIPFRPSASAGILSVTFLHEIFSGGNGGVISCSAEVRLLLALTHVVVEVAAPELP